MIAHYDNQPSKLEKIAGYKYRYHWDIHQEKKSPMNPEDEPRNEWVCNEIIVNLPLTRSYLVREAIHSIWDDDTEKKLINNYLEALADPEHRQEDIEAYTTFLHDRDSLKESIKADCIELGIADV